MLILAYCWSYSRRDRCTLSRLHILRDPRVVPWFYFLVWGWLQIFNGSMCVLVVIRGWNGGGGGVGWRGRRVCIDSLGPHLKRFSPAPSSHWGCCTLIRCAHTWDPRKQQCVVPTKVHTSYLITKINTNQKISIWAPYYAAHINIFKFIQNSVFTTIHVL